MSKFKEDGTRTIEYTLTRSLIKELNLNWNEHIRQVKPFPDRCRGKGIVMCFGGLGYYTCGLIAIRMLRATGCTLPVEVWYAGNELSDDVIDELGQYNVVCKNFAAYGRTTLSGVGLKPLAILNSSFKEVCFIDSDNICIKNPEHLFASAQYKKYGTIFWPDYWQTAPDNPIWKIIKRRYTPSPEQESGQILINKEVCWKEINLCVHFNAYGHIYHKLVLGDKDTFRFAWMALKTPFYMIKQELASCGYQDAEGHYLGTTMVQYDPAGEVCFLHRNLLKWHITKKDEKVWRILKRFRPDARRKEYFFGRSNAHWYLDLRGDTEEVNVGDVFGGYEETCMKYLQETRVSRKYIDFAIHTYFAKHRYTGDEKFPAVSW